jgi:hypothetical protein
VLTLDCQGGYSAEGMEVPRFKDSMDIDILMKKWMEGHRTFSFLTVQFIDYLMAQCTVLLWKEFEDIQDWYKHPKNHPHTSIYYEDHPEYEAMRKEFEEKLADPTLRYMLKEIQHGEPEAAMRKLKLRTASFKNKAKTNKGDKGKGKVQEDSDDSGNGSD